MYLVSLKPGPASAKSQFMHIQLHVIKIHILLRMCTVYDEHWRTFRHCVDTYVNTYTLIWIFTTGISHNASVI